jgi:hypothetical protein
MCFIFILILNKRERSVTEMTGDKYNKERIKIRKVVRDGGTEVDFL